MAFCVNVSQGDEQDATHQKQPYLTFQVGPLVNHAWGSSIEYVRELIYAARDADDDVSIPET
jgi:hypothetical protein